MTPYRNPSAPVPGHSDGAYPPDIHQQRNDLLCLCHADTAAIAVILYLDLIPHSGLVGPLVELIVCDKQPLCRVPFAFIQGIGDIDIFAADLLLVFPGSSRTPLPLLPTF